MEEKKGIKLPDAWVLLIGLAAVFAILSYIVPAGEYTRTLDEATGRMVVDPASFHYIERTPIQFFQFFKIIFQAFVKMADMIFFTLVVSGAFAVVRGTGAIDAGISHLVKSMSGREKMAIPLLVFVFSLFGAIMGCAEEMLPFYPIVVSLCVALGFDAVTGVAIVLCGTGAGFAGALMNPFTIGVAHGISGLPLFSGMGYRFITYVAMVSITAIYIWRYAGKVHADPSKSYLTVEERNNYESADISIDFTGRHKAVLIGFVLGILWMAFGVVKLGFYFEELAAVFLITGIAVGIIGGLSADRIVAEMVKGMSEMVYGAFMIGVATSVSLVMQDGNIMDTIIHALASLIQGFAPVISAVLMFIVQTLINFVVPSGSGQATVSMPIMAPLADIVGITRQTAVLAFQFGDGLSNTIYPTVGYMMAALALGKVKYPTWLKFQWKLFLIWSLVAAVFVAIAAAIAWGPF